MKSIMVAAAIALASFSAIASDNQRKTTADTSAWIFVTGGDDVSFSARKESFELTQTKDGTPVAAILGQYTIKSSKTVYLYRLYVSKRDCAAGYGKVVLLDTDGNYSSESDFVSKGDNIASGIADFICAVYTAVLEKQNGKSL